MLLFVLALIAATDVDPSCHDLPEDVQQAIVAGAAKAICRGDVLTMKVAGAAPRQIDLSDVPLRSWARLVSVMLSELQREQTEIASQPTEPTSIASPVSAPSASSAPSSEARLERPPGVNYAGAFMRGKGLGVLVTSATGYSALPYLGFIRLGVTLYVSPHSHVGIFFGTELALLLGLRASGGVRFGFYHDGDVAMGARVWGGAELWISPVSGRPYGAGVRGHAGVQADVSYRARPLLSLDFALATEFASIGESQSDLIDPASSVVALRAKAGLTWLLPHPVSMGIEVAPVLSLWWQVPVGVETFLTFSVLFSLL